MQPAGNYSRDNHSSTQQDLVKSLDRSSSNLEQEIRDLAEINLLNGSPIFEDYTPSPVDSSFSSESSRSDSPLSTSSSGTASPIHRVIESRALTVVTDLPLITETKETNTEGGWFWRAGVQTLLYAIKGAVNLHLYTFKPQKDVAAAKNAMAELLGPSSPRFIEMYDLFSNTAIIYVNQNLPEWIEGLTEPAVKEYAKYLSKIKLDNTIEGQPQLDYIEQLVKVNMANMFVNIARNLKAQDEKRKSVGIETFLDKNNSLEALAELFKTTALPHFKLLLSKPEAFSGSQSLDEVGKELDANDRARIYGELTLKILNIPLPNGFKDFNLPGSKLSWIPGVHTGIYYFINKKVTALLETIYPTVKQNWEAAFDIREAYHQQLSLLRPFIPLAEQLIQAGTGRPGKEEEIDKVQRLLEDLTTNQEEPITANILYKALQQSAIEIPKSYEEILPALTSLLPEASRVKRFPAGNLIYDLIQGVSTLGGNIASDQLQFYRSNITIASLLAGFFPELDIPEEFERWIKEHAEKLIQSNGGLSEDNAARFKEAIQYFGLQALLLAWSKNPDVTKLSENIQSAFDEALSKFVKEDNKVLLEAGDQDRALRAVVSEEQAIRKKLPNVPKNVPKDVKNVVTYYLQKVDLLEYQAKLQVRKEEMARLGWLKKAAPLLEFKASIQGLINQANKEGQSSEKDIIAGLKKKWNKECQQNPRVTELNRKIIYCDNLINLLSLSKYQLDFVTENAYIETQLAKTERDIERLDSNISLLEPTIRTLRLAEQPPEILESLQWMNETLGELKKLYTPSDNPEDPSSLLQKKALYELEREKRLDPFRELSNKLFDIMGFSDENIGEINLPPLVKTQTISILNSKKKTLIPAQLFEQKYPLIKSAVLLEANIEKLNELDPIAGIICENLAEDAIEQRTLLISSYRPLAAEIIQYATDNPAREQEAERLAVAIGNMVVPPLTIESLIEIYEKEKQPLVEKEKRLEELNKGNWVDDLRAASKTIDLNDYQNKVKAFIEQMTQRQDVTDEEARLFGQKIKQMICPQLITTESLVKTYETTFGTTLESRQRTTLLEKLDQHRLAHKVRMMLIQYEDIGTMVNKLVPGTNLAKIFVPILKNLIEGENAKLEQNRHYIKRIIKGILAARMLKMAEKHGSLANLFKTLADLARSKKVAALPSSDDKVHRILHNFLKKGFKIGSADDLEEIPGAVRTLVYDSLQRMLSLYAGPFVKAMVDKEANRKILKDLNGEVYFDIAQALISEQLETRFTNGLITFEAFAKEAFKHLSGKDPAQEQGEAFINELKDINKKTQINAQTLIEAYRKVTKQNVAKDKLDSFKINEKKWNEVLPDILLIEQLMEAITLYFPSINGELKEQLVERLNTILKPGKPGLPNQTRQHAIDFITQLAEGAAMHVAVIIAKKNPGDDNEASIVKVVKKLREALLEPIQNQFNEFTEKGAEELDKKICEDILGLTPSQDMLQNIGYIFLKGMIKSEAVKAQESFASVATDKKAVQNALDNLKTHFSESHVNTVLEMLSQVFVGLLPVIVGQSSGGDLVGSKVYQALLKAKIQEHSKVAEVILKYGEENSAQAAALKRIVGNDIDKLAKSKDLDAEKLQAVQFVVNPLLILVNNGISRFFNRVQQEGLKFNYEFLKNAFEAAGNQFKAYREAQSKGGFNHAKFVEAANGQLHPAVPRTEADYTQLTEVVNKALGCVLSEDKKIQLTALIKELAEKDKAGTEYFNLEIVIQKIENIHGTDLTAEQKDELKAKELDKQIRNMANSVEIQADQNFNKAAFEAFLNGLCPNKEKDLIFLPPDKQLFGWHMLLEQGPALVDLVVNLLTDRDTILSILVSSLEALAEAFEKPVDKQALYKQFANEINLRLNHALSDDEKMKLVKAMVALVRTKQFSVSNVINKLLVVKPGLVLNEQQIKAITELNLDKRLPKTEANSNLVKDPELEKVSSEMDQACGKFLEEAGELLGLPSFITNIAKKNAAGMGSALREQFHEAFWNDTFRSIFKLLGTKDKDGHYAIELNLASEEEKEIQLQQKRNLNEQKLAELPGRILNGIIASQVRQLWDSAEVELDEGIKRGVFGQLTHQAKQMLKALFKFIFIKVVGAVCYVLLYPIIALIKYLVLKTVRNKSDILTKAFTTIPADQPKQVNSNTSFHNKNLVYWLLDILKNSIESSPAA